MENKLTPELLFTDNVDRRTMDDTIEKKEELDPTVGQVKTDEEKRKEEDEKNAIKKVKTTEEQKKKAREAWEKEKEKVKGITGQDLSEEDSKKIEELIEQGVMPPPAIRGGSDAHAYEDFDTEKYKGNKDLESLAKEFKEIGLSEGMTEERLNEFKSRIVTMTSLGTISDEESQRINSDIHRVEIKLQQEKNDTAEDNTKQTTEQGEVDLSGDLGFEQIRELLSDLSDPDKPQRTTFETLKQIAGDLIQPFNYEKRERQEKSRDLNEILKIDDVSEFQRRLTPFLEAAISKRRKNYSEGKVEVPTEITSIQGLAKFIMNRQESALYGPFQKYALIDYIKDPETKETKEVFRADNFLIWVRDQIIQLHDDNRTSEMQPLSAVAIETQLRTITIYMMNRFRGQYFRDESTGEIMNDLADSAVNMCYLFGFFRNMDLAYRQVMNSDEKTPETITGIHSKNDVTHDDNWAFFLSMPDRFGQAKRDNQGNVMRNEQGEIVYDKDTKVGAAELVANDIYYNLSDVEELRDIAGERGSLVTKEGFKKALFLQQILGGKKYEWDNEGPDEVAGFYEKGANGEDNFYITDTITGKKVAIFNSSGLVDKDHEKAFHDFINFYNAPTADKSRVDFVRDLVKITIAEKVGIESGLARNKTELAERKANYEKIRNDRSKDDADKDYKRLVKSARINTSFAELSSYVQQRPLMVAARNDVNRRGYDASTKLDINYIIRQSSERTGGPIGNTEFLKDQILKNFGVDFIAGLKTESGRSPLEIFRDIRHVMNNPNLDDEQREDVKSKLLGELRFQENAALDYSSNAIQRAYQIFHDVVDGKDLNLDKIVTRTFWDGIKFNTAEFEKQIKDDFIKPMRYAFSSNSALKYGQRYRGFEQMVNGKPVYKWKTLAEHMFGDVVLDDIKKDAKKNNLKFEKFDEKGNEIDPKDMTEYERFTNFIDSSNGRTRIVKNVARARIAAEIKKHRERFGPAQRWNADMVNKLLLAFESMKEFEKDEFGNVYETGKKFFSDGDISWIRQHSGTGYKSMFAKEALGSGTVGVGKGLGSGLKDFVSDIFK